MFDVTELTATWANRNVFCWQTLWRRGHACADRKEDTLVGKREECDEDSAGCTHQLPVVIMTTSAATGGDTATRRAATIIEETWGELGYRQKLVDTAHHPRVQSPSLHAHPRARTYTSHMTKERHTHTHANTCDDLSRTHCHACC